ncbi:MAG: helix-turn-helix transcriptional regulator [Desulfomonile tiedjei]|nr:helix-turn-helix transcriptional regulator [Desulfomonile tiedjei]
MTENLIAKVRNVCCPAKSQDDGSSLLSERLAAELEGLFKVLANRTRLRMLHTMVCCQEICVNDLAERLGMKAQAVSNQLQRLVDRRIVSARRQGSNIFYKFVDPCVQILLDRGLCLMEDTRREQTLPLMGPGDSLPVSFDHAGNGSSQVGDESIQQKGNIAHE